MDHEYYPWSEYDEANDRHEHQDHHDICDKCMIHIASVLLVSVLHGGG
jgi:hypothetical protein